MLPKAITSLQHPIVKHATALQKEKKERYSHEEVLVPGLKMLLEVKTIKTLFVLDGEKIPAGLVAKEVFSVPIQVLEKITGLPSPEPYAGIVSLPKEADLKGKKSLLVLDHLSDPGNVGTLIRSAYALGWEGVFFVGSVADPFSSRGVRACKGAIFRMPYRWGSIEDFFHFAKEENLSMLAADMKGTPVNQIKKGPVSLIMGQEARGLSKAFSEVARICVPIKGNMESLNVAAAGAILLYELSQP